MRTCSPSCAQFTIAARQREVCLHGELVFSRLVSIFQKYTKYFFIFFSLFRRTWIFSSLSLCSSNSRSFCLPFTVEAADIKVRVQLKTASDDDAKS